MELIISIVSLILFIIILVSIYGTHQETKKLRQIEQQRLALDLIIATGQSIGKNYVNMLANDESLTATQRDIVLKAIEKVGNTYHVTDEGQDILDELLPH